MEHQDLSGTARRWDAGENGCAQLIVALRRQIAKLRRGESLTVIAHDAGAPADLPSWCRMTGHTLVSAAHPEYVIRRTRD